MTAAETWLSYTIRMTDIKETQETRPIMPGTEDSDRPLVELTHVEKHYGDLHVLKDINLTVKKGEGNKSFVKLCSTTRSYCTRR